MKRRHRPRTFTVEQIQAGIGVLLEEAPDYPAADRAVVAGALEAASKRKRGLRPADRDLADRARRALLSDAPMMSALRFHLGLDGVPMFDALWHLARVVPAVRRLAAWVSGGWMK